MEELSVPTSTSSIVDPSERKSNDFSVVKLTALTTTDNPFDPFTQFDSWYKFDMEKGYNTSGLLARFARTSDESSDFDNAQAIEEAIDTILWVFKGSNLFKKIEMTSHLDYENEEGEGGL